MATLLLAAFVTAGAGSVAQADHGRDRGPRYRDSSRDSYRGRDTRVVTRYQSPGSVYSVRRSSAGPAIAGFLGGLFLGATLAHSAPAGYGYYDPYCDENFVSLEVYQAHLRRYHHPRVIRVIELDNGDCVDSYRYQNGQWDNDQNRDQYRGQYRDQYQGQYRGQYRDQNRDQNRDGDQN